jgi:hypothetical protein
LTLIPMEGVLKNAFWAFLPKKEMRWEREKTFS